MTEKVAHGNQIVTQYGLPDVAGLMHRLVRKGTMKKSKYREGSSLMTGVTSHQLDKP